MKNKGVLNFIDDNGVEHILHDETTAEMVIYDNNGTDTTVADFLSNISANTAEYADVAEKAEKDSAGNVISTTYAPKNSPAFTGTPTAPTSNDLDLLTNQVATVAWCNNVFKRFTGIVPENMDTLQEFWEALGEDSDLATTISTELATKQDKSDKLTAFSNLSLSADKLILATGANSFSTTTLTSTGKSLITATSDKDIRRALKIYRATFYDECENVWQTVGSPTIGTANAKFDHAAQFANNQGLFTRPILIGEQDFTIDLWCYMDLTTPDLGVFLHLAINTAGTGTDSYKNAIILARNNANDALIISVCDTNGDALLENKIQEVSPTVSMLGTFRHYEIDYKFETQTIYLFADGDLKYSKSGVNIERVSRFVVLGLNNINRSHSLIGAISEFRLLDGVCAHTSNFTPPNEKYVADANTISLLHFD